MQNHMVCLSLRSLALQVSWERGRGVEMLCLPCKRWCWLLVPKVIRAAEQQGRDPQGCGAVGRGPPGLRSCGGDPIEQVLPLLTWLPQPPSVGFSCTPPVPPACPGSLVPCPSHPWELAEFPGFSQPRSGMGGSG